jgi:hypothetical protein
MKASMPAAGFLPRKAWTMSGSNSLQVARQPAMRSAFSA